MRHHRRDLLDRLVGLSATVLLIAGATACGDYGGGSKGNSGSVTVQTSTPSGLSRTEEVEAFRTTVYPVVSASCGGGCHDTGTRRAPFLFAHPDVGMAFTFVDDFDLVDFSDPNASALVRRPARDFHQCGNECVQIGIDMLAAVERWAQLVSESGSGPEDTVAVEGIQSQEVAFAAGEEIELGERYTENLIAFYDFKEGEGPIAYDRSGVEPHANLVLGEGVTWMSSYGLEFDEGYAEAGQGGSVKLYTSIAEPGVGTEQYTIEAWVENGNVTQEEARIVGYTRSNGRRNFTLEQQLYTYEYRNRTTAGDSGNDGRPTLATYDVDQDAQETLQHVVITYDRVNGRRIYVDSYYTGDDDPSDGGRLWNWERYETNLTIGGQKGGGGRYWRGKMRMLAIYKQALNPDQIRQNYLAGVGKRVRLSFSLEEWTGDETAVEFAVTELDDYSYLFCQPTFVGRSLDGMYVKNMQIAVNPQTGGGPAGRGQAFTTVERRLSGEQDQVSRTCSIIPQDGGQDVDSFSLVFEDLSYFTDESIQPIVFEYTVPDTQLELPPEVGVRDFERIHATMAALTGVDPTQPRAVNPDQNPTIQEIFEDIQQQLPSTVEARSFGSSHQVGITRLAFEYCVEMVDRPNLRAQVFGNEFEATFFASDVATAYGDTTLASLMTVRLAEHMLGSRQLVDQPSTNAIIGDLDTLRDELVADCASCDATRTRSIAKGLCTAALASAPVMVH